MAKIKAGTTTERQPELLGTVVQGRVVRFFNTSFEDAIGDDAQDKLFMVLDKVNNKGDTIGLVPISGKGSIIYRTKDFPVFSHEVEITVFKGN